MISKYVVVAGCVLGLALGYAPIFAYTLPILIKPMALQAGWDRTTVSSGISVAMLGVALFSPVCGHLIDKFGAPRVINWLGLGFGGVVMAFAGLQPSITMFLFLCALAGLLGSVTTPLGYLSILPKWFDKRLGFAMGVAMLGAGLGLAIVPPIAVAMMQHFSWRQGYLALGAVALLASLIGRFILKTPSETNARTLSSNLTDGVDARTATGSATFWIFALCIFTTTMALVGCGLHLTSMLTDRGMPLATAVNALSTMGIALAISRLGTGYLLDRLPTRLVAFLTFAVGSSGVALLSLQFSPPLVAWVGAACIGLSQGAEGDLMAYAVRRYFGPRAYGKIYGLLFSAFNFGVVAGPLAMGIAFDKSGSYYVPMKIFAGCAFAAAILVLFIGRPRFNSAGATPSASPTLDRALVGDSPLGSK